MCTDDVQKCQCRIICCMGSFWIFMGSLFGSVSLFLIVHVWDPIGAVVVIVSLIPILIGCSLCYCAKKEFSEPSTVMKENVSNIPKLERIEVLPAQVSHSL